MHTDQRKVRKCEELIHEISAHKISTEDPSILSYFDYWFVICDSEIMQNNVWPHPVNLYINFRNLLDFHIIFHMCSIQYRLHCVWEWLCDHNIWQIMLFKTFVILMSTFLIYCVGEPLTIPDRITVCSHLFNIQKSNVAFLSV
jgi:hypothetical protein